MTTYVLRAFPRYTNVNTTGQVTAEQTEILTMAPVEIHRLPRHVSPFVSASFGDHVWRMALLFLFILISVVRWQLLLYKDMQEAGDDLSFFSQ